MAWIAVALASAAASGVLSIVDKQTVSKYVPSFAVFAMIMALGSILWSFVALVFFPFTSELSLREAGIALLSGVLWGTALGLHMFVLRTGEVSRVSPVFHTYPAVVAMLGVTFLDEHLSWVGWVAVLLTVSGAILISIKGLPVSSGARFRNTFTILMVAASVAAVGQITSKYVLDSAPFWNIFVLRNFGIALPLLSFASRKSVLGLVQAMKHPVGRYYIILGEFVYGSFAVGLALFAVNLGPVSVVSALLATRPVFVFIYSSLLSTSRLRVMEEPVNRNTLAFKALAIAMVVMGVGTISLL